METKTWEGEIDRTGWPAGEWDKEPDRKQWLDKASGLPCLVVRNSLGAWCGYVGVPPGHPLYEQNYNDADEDLDVHGGLTFARKCHGRICHQVGPGEEDAVWWLGFDCGHYGDLMPGMRSTGIYRNVAYVEAECRRLAAQLKQKK